MRIFVAGLSKSGKTTRCLSAAEQIPELEYVSVSQLLREAGCVLPVATLAEGLANQQTAAKSLLAHTRSRPHQIIDGHLVIETEEGPLLVPDKFFEGIRPGLLIHVQDSPKAIFRRRTAGASTVAEITALAGLEQLACERIAARFRIPLVAMKAPTPESFSQELQKQLTTSQ
jgi:adenylate kinase